VNIGVIEGDERVAASRTPDTATPVFGYGRNNLEIMSTRFACVFIDRHNHLLSGWTGNSRNEKLGRTFDMQYTMCARQKQIKKVNYF
jgi:hypothetical protein